MRLDRASTLYIAQPIKRFFTAGRHISVPVLMYHSISEHRATWSHPYFDVDTDISVFDAQVRHLEEKRYLALSLDDLPYWFQLPDAKRRRAVVITFDDGYEDFLTAALPVLLSHGLGATAFLPTGRIGMTSKVVHGRRHLSWSQILELRRLGILIGSHTVNHLQLGLLSERQIRYELEASKAILEDRLGESITCFSHPFGFPGENRIYEHQLIKPAP